MLNTFGNFKNGHGLAIVHEGDREVLFITTNQANGMVYKTDLQGKGKVLQSFSCPMESKLYKTPKEFKPSKTLHLPDGRFYIVDGYGKDYLHLYSKEGVYQSSFGGDLGEGEARIQHWGPHGGAIDLTQNKPLILLACSDQEKLKKFRINGEWVSTHLMPGGNPRDALFHRDHWFIPHLGDNWPKDRNAAGFISILNRQMQVVTHLGGTKKQNLFQHDQHLFRHPHGICFDQEGNLYVAQFSSGGTWPLKFTPQKQHFDSQK